MARPPEPRSLHWCKTTDPDLRLPELPAGTDARVLLPDGDAFDDLRARLTESGVAHRSVRHWIEDEVITTVGVDALTVTTALTSKNRRDWGGPTADGRALDARDAFAAVWDAHGPVEQVDSVPAADLVPAEWLDHLPFPVLNPAQAHAAPAVLGSTGHLVITAPTGAGKTVVGMLAVLKAILGEGRKAAWLVPQRSLTDELDRELASWRGRGLRVERLSGEHLTDAERVRAADLWVATTEKFEAICRASSLQAALAEVGCLVVDEVHLLGAPERGPLLEALLARVRGAGSPVRIVGLSATVSNAEEIASWLGGELVATTWRPTTLTWQLPQIPATSDRTTDSQMRTRVAVDLTRQVTADGGSVLVFCGTKPNVRTTALAIAASRGAPTAGVHIDDTDRLHRVCASVGVGLHYKDWDHKREAEERFRARDWDVLVATTTVAAGVNLPARAVVVRDTRVGLDDVDVATVLQMFGRAGRVGAGERAGWAYLVTSELERANWQAALVDGYAVHSQIHESLPDHVLAEVVQGRVTTVAEAEAWWLRTLCHHQGDQDTEPVVSAVLFLVENGYLSVAEQKVVATELGLLTARLMVGTQVGAALRAALAKVDPPHDPDVAEDVLIALVALLVPELAHAPVAEPLRPAVATIVKAGGRRDLLRPSTAVSGLGSSVTCAPGDLAKAALLLVAHSPQLFARGGRVVAGLPQSTLFPVLDQAPRYLAWLAAQGYTRTAHPWVAVVAGDLARRVRWRRLGPGRGAGRLLWMCEQMAPAPHTDEDVPRLWQAARSRGVAAPDWPHTTPPRGCRLDQGEYLALLRDRCTGAELTPTSVTGLTAGVLVAWKGEETAGTAVVDSAEVDLPSAVDAAVFTRRGDHKATGALAAYQAIDERVGNS
ncbi:DEAD/DEAH box helicase [Actinokineospora bangkokensis]|uniref:DEAD/DEAH box helicase n=1 Tax=Actinokineospora bangkokensis TaxID=1193682 RepID=A0A1Q9LM50_9PSEU|nr:DEAD/DEAH box helicase [Actinokineospora bangkokensis]